MDAAGILAAKTGHLSADICSLNEKIKSIKTEVEKGKGDENGKSRIYYGAGSGR